MSLRCAIRIYSDETVSGEAERDRVQRGVPFQLACAKRPSLPLPGQYLDHSPMGPLLHDA